MKKIKLISVFITTIGFSSSYAQKAITTLGGNAFGSGGSVSYSVGQLVCKTNNNTQFSIIEGVQQPYEILVVTGLEEAQGINLINAVYPNPTTNFATLKIENYKIENLSYQFNDVNGKLLLNKKITSSETHIPMETFSVGSYFLNVIHNNTAIKSLKIIKNK
jgi:hypothetical protein